MAYLRGIGTRDELLSLIGKIKDEDNGNAVEPIWDSISDAVATKMFDEFGSLYASGKSSDDFMGLISNGEYVELDGDELEALIHKDRATSSLSRDGVFAVRSSSLTSKPEADVAAVEDINTSAGALEL